MFFYNAFDNWNASIRLRRLTKLKNNLLKMFYDGHYKELPEFQKAS